MARTREFDPADALEQAMLLFWGRGFAETSIDDVVATTGVSRYGLYSAFGNKRKLYIASLEHYGLSVVRKGQSRLFSPDARRADIAAFMAAAVERCIGPEGARGCFLCNTAVEVAPHDAAIADAVREHIEQIATTFANAIRNSQAVGEINQCKDPKALGDLLVGILQGAVVMGRVGTGRTRLTAYMKTAMGVLD